jgi:ATP/maltotriose-dependent transcriptional regulator MalT
MDSGDQDLASFFHQLKQAVGAFARKGPRLPAMTPEYLATVPAFARRFFRELFQCLHRPATLVLDKYQEVPANHSLHELVANAAEEVPQNVSLVLISRRDPPGTYARLLAYEHVQTGTSDYWSGGLRQLEGRLRVALAEALGRQAAPACAAGVVRAK